MEEIKTTIDEIAATDLLFGIRQLTEGLANSTFAFSLNGVLNRGKDCTEGESAVLFLHENYDLLMGANLLISAAARVFTDMLVNADIEIVAKKEKSE